MKTKSFRKHVDSAKKSFRLTVPGNAEPDMISMKIANRGDRTLHDVRVNTDKQFGDFHSLDTILASAGVEKVEPTVENLKKLMWFYVQSRSAGRSALAKAIVENPVLHFNIANTGMCCWNNGVAALLAQKLGFRCCGSAASFWHGDHAISAVMMDNELRLLDIHTPFMLSYRKGSLTELVPLEDCLAGDDRNPYARIGDAAGLAADMQTVKDLMQLLEKHGHEPILVKPCQPLNSYDGTTMRMDLRAGESIEWPLKNVSSQGLTNTQNRFHSMDSDGGGKWWRPKFSDDVTADRYEEPQMYGNGRIVYRPDFTTGAWRDGMLSRFRIESRHDTGLGSNLHPDQAGKYAEIIWEMANPYVTVGGRLRGAFTRKGQDDWLKVYVSADPGSLNVCSWGEINWGSPIYEAPVGEAVEADLDIDKIVCKQLGPMCQRYWVKVLMQAAGNKTDVGIEGIEIDTDFLFDLHARPHLECGPNK
ncbi:MAG: hypothetical protein HQ546_00525, partial [Planctomycetes bacterium]|nr:hypothetical protein [Planctomycetota bacterium]